MVKSEAKKFMEEVMIIEKRQPQQLIGDITTGYRYVDTDTAERIAEAKRRKDEVDAMRYSLITDTLKTELNKVYGTAAYEKEKDLAMAICKKFLGTNKSKSNYCDIFDKWIPEEKVVEEKEEKPIGIALGKYALEHDMNPSTLRKMCREGKIPANKINGMWYIKSIEE